MLRAGFFTTKRIHLTDLILGLGLALIGVAVLALDPDGNWNVKWALAHATLFTASCAALTSRARSRWMLSRWDALALAGLALATLAKPESWDGTRLVFAASVFALARSASSIESMARASAIGLAIGHVAFALQALWLAMDPNRIGLTSEQVFAGSFANANIAAEFLLLSIPFFAAQVTVSRGRAVFLGLIAVDAYALFALRSRSAEIGLVGAIMASLWATGLVRRRRLAAGLVLAGSATAISGLMWAQGFALDKAASLSERWDVWSATLHMIGRDSFMGSGRGEFLFRFSEFRKSASETQLFAGPHCEVLRVLAEDGALWTLALVLVGIACVWRARSLSGPARVLAWAFGFAILPQILFQFPFENPFPTLAAAIVGASLFAGSDSSVAVRPQRQLAVNLAIAAILFAAAVAMVPQIKADHATIFRASDPNALAAACADAPTHRRACLAAGLTLLRGAQFERCLTVIRPVATRFPAFPTYRRLMGACSGGAGDLKAACSEFRAYLRLSEDEQIRTFFDASCKDEAL